MKICSLLVLAAATAVLAITTSSSDAALATSISESFHSESSRFKDYKSPDRVAYTDSGLQLTLAKRYDNPSVVSSFYIFFGKVEARIKVANGTGIVSTMYLQSDDLDEMDFEWLGGDDTQAQLNFFSQGDTSSYDRGAFHSVSQPQASFHTYTIDWTYESVKWYIDGTLVRTLSNSSADGFPQTPSKLYVGVWAGGDPSNEAGTIEWAGGETDYSKTPFVLYLSDLKVTDYSSGSEYKYSDSTGDWSSIEAVDGEVMGNYDGSSSSSSSASSSSSSSSASSSSSSSASKTTSASSSTTSGSSSTASKSASATVSDGSSSAGSFTSDSSDPTSTSSTTSSTTSSASSGASSSNSSPSTQSSNGASSTAVSSVGTFLLSISVAAIVL